MKRIVTILIALSIMFGYCVMPIAAASESISVEIEIEEEEPVRSPEGEIEIEEPIIVPEEEKVVIIEEEKYPEARLIWDTIISWGWSTEVAAGIIGNMMAEIGGGTLDLSRWNSDKGCGYGLCQWTGGRGSSIKARYGAYPNIEQQLIYMKDEMLGTNGVRAQVSTSQLEQILSGTSPEAVAYLFACYFERCGQAYRARREGYARIAYDYFYKGE